MRTENKGLPRSRLCCANSDWREGLWFRSTRSSSLRGDVSASVGPYRNWPFQLNTVS